MIKVKIVGYKENTCPRMRPLDERISFEIFCNGFPFQWQNFQLYQPITSSQICTSVEGMEDQEDALDKNLAGDVIG